MSTFRNLKEIEKFLKENGIKKVDVGFILGTGLGKIADFLKSPIKIPYKEIPNFPKTTVMGHSGFLFFGKKEKANIMIFQGRFHYYEGYSIKEITYPVKILKAFGTKILTVLNAAGGLNPFYKPGDIMRIEDHINLFPENPLRGENYKSSAQRFPLMINCYDRKIGKEIDRIAEKLNIPLKKGVYVGWQGPSLETRAEYRFLRIIGGDAVGMSTVPEVIIARANKMKVLGFSVITNMGIGKVSHATHRDILKIAEKGGEILKKILGKWLKEKFS